ncbi:ATP-binding protein [Catellatospora tritici]|uniref:ATP-binding protein n=1 Tax=Catellatospora tritici TaxID=2851566 RepID=UPI001C2D5F15|nr:LuxR C-terminal-related transcriptional regulator [Catellatospora tritici]MBV1849541.1 LuxR C-terminal-related transcriptional regulator [Catellatospora tritici]MBV1854113.1 LuxR C-terminal-related transcriptional regulator [Catellatospora tritici]
MTAQSGISAREAEVLTLLGEHLSNAEIGARLFISVRTVETHVSSLLRKLDAPDRRALAQLAAEWSRAARGGKAVSGLPAAVTSFVGRAGERAALAAAVKAHRQVSAVGPGGVGKTRLALAVAADTAGDFPDGVWFVDLVPITDPAMVGAAVAAAVGVGEQQSRGIDESVLAALADRHALLVLDNCEHVRDGVAPFLERLLTKCPRLTVLATSRARLMVPFERVHPVPPLSLTGDGDSDAVALLLDRAAAVGWPLAPEQLQQSAEICRGLDGVALAIELAAARLPTLGLDGLADLLSDQLRLTGGARADDRHRSVRAMLDWSHELLDPADRTLLRRVSVFVAPFTADAAGQVAGFGPLAPAVADGLARLTEQSLLTVLPSAGGTRYRTLETIRQYGVEQLTAHGELDELRTRHLRWCLRSAGSLAEAAGNADGPWRARFDAVADDLRAALGWATTVPEHRDDAYRLAVALAGLAFARNLVGESQQRYEQAAALTADPAAAAAALRSAASVAGCRLLGDDMYRLRQAAAEAALQAGDQATAARDLATAATTAYRFSGMFTRVPSAAETMAQLTAARELAADDAAGRAAVALAEAAVLTDTFGSDQGPPENTVADTLAAATRAVELARLADDPLTASAALDGLAGAQSWAGDSFGAAATARGRIEMLSAVPVTPSSLHELTDALVSGIDTSLGVGDLPMARRWARQLADLPLLAEVGHYATCWLLMVEAMAVEVDTVLVAGERFREAWERTGRLRAPRLAIAAAAVAMIHGLRGDDAARADWLGIAEQLGSTPERSAGYGAVFDAIVDLHHGRVGAALDRVAAEPEDVWKWVTWIWLHWYVVLRAEAAALAGHPDARKRIEAARVIVSGNPIASAQVERAAALLTGDRDAILATGAAFDAAGCRYQWARTLVLAGGEHTAIGASALAATGCVTPAATPQSGR